VIRLTLPYPETCVEFDGAKHSRGGYGVLRHAGKLVRAHRLAYCQAHGVSLAEIDGKSVRHKCDNPPCINPAHLQLGTHTDNMRDMAERGRNRQPKGVRNAKAKLTEQQVRDVRAMLAAGFSQRRVAADFSIDRSVVCRIHTRKIWGHLS